jgi:hypothetical protein
MRRESRRRALWLTAPLYAVTLGILALDVWATSFWVRVGGSLGWGLAGVETAVALLLAVLLLMDARRQWLLTGPTDDRPIE